MPSLSRIVITKLENKRREAVSVAEIMLLAKVLEVAPVLLLFPLGKADKVELFPGQWEDTPEAVRMVHGHERRVSRRAVHDAPVSGGALAGRQLEAGAPGHMDRGHG